MNKVVLAAIGMTAMAAGAANLTWVGGAEGDWNTATNWDPQQVPTNKDTVFFDSEQNITVNLGATQIFATLSVSNTPCLKFVGAASGSEIQVQQDSKGTLYAPVVFDENTYVKFLAGKVWTNNSTIDFLGGVGANNTTPTLGGTGLYKVRGPVDFPAGVTLAAPIDWNPSSVSAATIFNVGGGDLQFNFGPVVLTNDVRFSGGTGGFGGSAPLFLQSTDPERPSAAINQYANPNFYLRRTMPVIIEDWLSLCRSDSRNNAKVGFNPGSGANLWINGKITTSNASEPTLPGNNDDYGLRLTFYGCGASVRLLGDGDFVGKGGNSATFDSQRGVGYNAVVFDGSGSEIHPFGAIGEKVFSNDGGGVFFKALSPNKTLLNGFSYGNSVNNNNAYTFGFDGTNDLTIAGDLVLGTGNSMLPVIDDMTLTLTGTIDPKSTHLDIAGTGDVVLGPTSTFAGSTGTLQKHSAGSMTLQGTLSGTSYNRAYFAGGTTVLDYSADNTSRLNTANSVNLETPVALADALRLRGTELVLKGGSFAETVGSGNGTTFQNGLTKIRRDGGTSTIYLGALSPSATASDGSLVAVDVEDGVATVSSALAGQNLKGAYTVDGDHFAKVGANGVIAKADDTIATKYVGSATAARSVVDYLIFEPTAEGQSFSWNGTSDGAFVANKDGMIFRGDYDYTIDGGYLAGANTYNGGLVFTCAGKGVLTFTGKLDRYGFVKSGPGTFKHTGTSNLSMALSVYEGVFEFASENGTFLKSGSGTVYLNGGTLKTSVDATLERPLSVGDNGGVIEVVANTTFTQTANIVTTADNTSGPVVKRGGGVWLPSGDFQAQSELRIEEGTVKLGSTKGIGDSTARVRSVAPTRILEDGTLDVASFKAHVGNVYLRGGKIVDTVGGGSLGAYTFFAESGEVSVPLTNVACPNNSNYLVANNLEKTTAGTVTLSAANEFTGTAFVHDGKLLVSGSLAGSAWVDGGVLESSGSIAGYAYAVDGGAITATPGATLSFGDKLAIGANGCLRVTATPGAFGSFELTSANGAVYIAEGAILDFDFNGGKLGALAGEHVIVALPDGATVEGEFANFTDGKYVDASGNKFMINYAGGDGNDIVLTCRGSGFAVIVR